MNLKIKIGTVGYNNKILVFDEKFNLGKNDEVNFLLLEEPVIPVPKVMSHNAIAQQTITQAQKPTTHKDEKIALVLFLTGGFAIWNIFR